ncbi:unnamed protein product [Debaryomyces tyrocola]|nr:unnamed protein product [Debaryomyces tyrocola]
MSMSYPGKNHVAPSISCKILIDIEYQSSSINHEVMIKDEDVYERRALKIKKKQNLRDSSKFIK